MPAPRIAEEKAEEEAEEKAVEEAVGKVEEEEAVVKIHRVVSLMHCHGSCAMRLVTWTSPLPAMATYPSSCSCDILTLVYKA